MKIHIIALLATVESRRGRTRAVAASQDAEHKFELFGSKKDKKISKFASSQTRKPSKAIPVPTLKASMIKKSNAGKERGYQLFIKDSLLTSFNG